MATYSDITTLLSSGAYIDGKNWVTSAEGKSKFKNLIDYDLGAKSLLSNFYDDTFKVGAQNTFEDISVDFEASVNKAVEIMNSYAVTAKAAKEAIEAAIAKDAEAARLAQAAYDAIMEDTASYTYADTEDGEPYLHSAEQKSDAEAAYVTTWEANCWKPGK